MPVPVRDYRELFEAAQFFYRYYQDEAVYGMAIRSLAAGVQPVAWGEDVRRIVTHYRRYRGRELVGIIEQNGYDGIDG